MQRAGGRAVASDGTTACLARDALVVATRAIRSSSRSLHARSSQAEQRRLTTCHRLDVCRMAGAATATREIMHGCAESLPQGRESRCLAAACRGKRRVYLCCQPEAGGGVERSQALCSSPPSPASPLRPHDEPLPVGVGAGVGTVGTQPTGEIGALYYRGGVCDRREGDSTQTAPALQRTTGYARQAVEDEDSIPQPSARRATVES
jgi:hypothetical protein